MKKVFLFFALMAVLVSCQNKNAFTINGTVADPAFEGKNVYVQQLVNNTAETVDTLVVENGAFTLKGVADSTFLRIITLESVDGAKTPSQALVLIEPGVISVKLDSVNVVSGTAVNDAYNAFSTSMKDLTSKARALGDDYRKAVEAGTMTDSIEAEISDAYDVLQDEMTQINFDFMKSNIGNALGQHLFAMTGRSLDFDKQKEILDLSDETFKTNPAVVKMIARIENAEKVSIGNKFVDFTMKNPEGKEVSLSDYAGKGKYVLVDFWAAWCGPCRQEMPNVVAAYKTFKNKGFEVVGVSLDNNEEAWKKGIKDLNMTWPQMSDLKFWDSPVVMLYAFSGIPHTVLLDKDGTIIEKNLRGKELDEKLAELMP